VLLSRLPVPSLASPLTISPFCNYFFLVTFSFPVTILFSANYYVTPPGWSIFPRPALHEAMLNSDSILQFFGSYSSTSFQTENLSASKTTSPPRKKPFNTHGPNDCSMRSESCLLVRSLLHVGMIILNGLPDVLPRIEKRARTGITCEI